MAILILSVWPGLLGDELLTKSGSSRKIFWWLCDQICNKNNVKKKQRIVVHCVGEAEEARAAQTLRGCRSYLPSGSRYHCSLRKELWPSPDVGISFKARRYNDGFWLATTLLKVLQPPGTAPPAGDQVCKCMRLWGHFTSKP